MKSLDRSCDLGVVCILDFYYTHDVKRRQMTLLFREGKRTQDNNGGWTNYLVINNKRVRSRANTSKMAKTNSQR